MVDELNDTPTTESQDAQDVQTEQVQGDADQGGAQPVGATVLDSEDKPVAAPADWPEDWRQKLAGEDEKSLKQLERYKSPKDMANALRAAQQKISSGEFKQALAEGATEEEIAEYRKANGIPETPDGYLEQLPDGLIVGEEDKTVVASFLEAVHGDNAPPSVVAKALDWYYKEQERVLTEKQAQFDQHKRDAEDALRAEWGNEYRANMNSITNFLTSAPALADGTSMSDALAGTLMPDGSSAMTNPAFVRWMANMADAINPAGVIVPGDGATQLESVNSELAKIAEIRRTDPDRYYKDEDMQKRYQDLLVAQDKLGPRAA